MTAHNPYFDDLEPPHHHRLSFSITEIWHLTLAVVILTVAFTFVLHDVDGSGIGTPLERLAAPISLYVASFFAVASGFVLHELGHKVVAQRYGHWAEFRGHFSGLLISLAFALGLGFLFAAPGAVMIFGRVTNRENGLISITGPAVNFVIALLAFPFTFATDIEAPFPAAMRVVATVNAFLCVFNLLPVWNLDGKKVWYWSKLAYIFAMGAAVALLVAIGLRGLFL